MKNLVVVLFSMCAFISTAQNVSLTLTVVNEVGDALPNAYISINDSVAYAITDLNGQCTLLLPKRQYNLMIRYLGYEMHESFIQLNDHTNKIIILKRDAILFQEITVYGSVADKNKPVTYTNIKGENLNDVNYGQDLPILLNGTPSAVVTSDAGTGIGYTGIRIRGSDPTRVNITLNGIPFNDAESQQAYWVDLPDFAASVDEAQIQRGIGTSVNGVSAMGASINLYTNDLNEEASTFVNAHTGSFGLKRINTGFSTGRMKDHLFMEARLSRTVSDGYIDRAFADLSSFFLTAAWDGQRYRSVVNVFSGEERTYQAWGGVPKDSLTTNRTYNPYTYENQTDNYTQTHVQWHHDYRTIDGDTWNLSLNYTRGIGYYEQLEYDQNLSSYGLPDFVFNDTVLSTTDLVTQKWLDNHMLGLNFQNRKSNNLVDWVSGGGFFQYIGNHYGKVVSGYLFQPGDSAYLFYDDDAFKNDANIYTQMSWNAHGKIKYWADLQGRYVGYHFTGLDSTGAALPDQVNLLFFNPKLGLNINWTREVNSYFSLSASGREPNRNDYVESGTNSRPKPEYLYDLELGQRMSLNGWELAVNGYLMYYRDQLVLTGEINDVGAYTRSNIPESYRTGLELAASKWLITRVMWEGNLSISQNKIVRFSNFIDVWDDGTQQEEVFTNVDIAFSPSVVGFSQLKWVITDNRNIRTNDGFRCFTTWTSKYVSRQFLDNTGNVSRSLDPYLVNDWQLNAEWNNSFGAFSLMLRINNLLNTEYEANGWVYRYIFAGEEGELNGYFPQAGRHIVTGFSWKF